MRTILARATNEALPSYAPVVATPITSTTFSIDGVHSGSGDVTPEFVAGDSLHGSAAQRAKRRVADDRGRAHPWGGLHRPFLRPRSWRQFRDNRSSPGDAKVRPRQLLGPNISP
jgi:hypothetical protein